MSEYEVTFIVEPMSDETQDAVLAAFDCVTGQNHGGQHFITLTAVGEDAVEAIKAAAFRLHFDHGVEVRHAEYDLANRGQIAYRLDTTTQAVGLWTRGERLAEHPFPEPFNDVAGGVWLWGDVVNWVRKAKGTDPVEGLEFPTREQIEEANESLRRQYAPPPAGQMRFVLRTPIRHGGGDLIEFVDRVSVYADAHRYQDHPVVETDQSRKKHRV